MDWEDVPQIWQRCFELAWDAHLRGSNPIAAVIADQGGTIISTGQSATKATLPGARSANCEIAHAEVNALLAVDNRRHSKTLASTYTLFATLEPCPLCFSALYMSDVKKLVFAASDRYGGSTNLLGTTPYLSRKSIEVTGPVEFLDEISIFLNVYSDRLRGIDAPDVVHQEFARDYPEAVKAASELAPSDSLEIRQQVNFEEVYARIQETLIRSGTEDR